MRTESKHTQKEHCIRSVLCFKWVSRSVSRVLYLVIIYLGPLLPAGLKRPTYGKRRAAALHVPAWSCSRWGLQSRKVASTLVSSYLAFPPLPRQAVAVYFCCTILGVASTGDYPAPCSVELGLSSQPKPRDYLICSWNSLQETGRIVKVNSDDSTLHTLTKGFSSVSDSMTATSYSFSSTVCLSHSAKADTAVLSVS